MNKILTIEYLYDVFEYALENDRDPRVFFNTLFLNKDFVNMISNKPFNISKVLDMVNNSEKKRTNINKNQIRYLSFLISEFIDRVDISIQKIPNYISATDIFSNFNYYHSQDIDNIIFELITKHNEKYKIRKSSANIFIKEDLLLDNFLRLYPIKKYKNFNVIYDKKLMMSLYIYDNNLLFFANDIEQIINDDYFVQRYCLGNKVYCFTNSSKQVRTNFALYIFRINESSIDFVEPSGRIHYFFFSN